MKILTLPEEVQLSPTHIVPPDVYYAGDISAAQLYVHANGGELEPMTETRPLDETKDWNGKKILFVRMGGFGDLVLMTPVLREIKRRWPGAFLAVSTMELYGSVLENLPYVDAVLSYPIEKQVADNFDAWVFLENAIEKNPRAEKVHMTDLFAELAGLNDPTRQEVIAGKPYALQDKKPEYRPTSDELIWAKVQYPRREGVRRLVVQVDASGMARMYPVDMTNMICEHFVRAGWEVFLMGKEGGLSGVKENHRLRNLASHGHSFRMNCAVIAGADCVLGPDSALVHIGGALDVPTVALYGPFPHELRTEYAPSIKAIQGSDKCSPCFFHATLRHQFPKDGPCAKTGRCEVLAKIAPKTIIQAIEKAAKEAP